MASTVSSRPVHGFSNMATSAAMSPMQEPTPPDNMKQEDEPDPARAKAELSGRGPGDDQGEDGDNNQDHSSNSDEGPNRKRRRSRKGLDKKFECPHDGCGKSYSRAEHL